MNLENFSNICGNTPLIKISEKIYAKLETFNPTGSVKDRMVSYVVEKAIAENKIGRDTILCEATSGNTGISLSAIAAAMGKRCVIFMPSNMSEERKQMMRVYGSEIIEAPPNDFEEAIRMRNDFVNKNKNAWTPNQFSNLDNVECHRLVTGPEIHRQVNRMKVPWSIFIHGSGTGGTIEGIRQYALERGLVTEVCMTIPAESPHGIQGIGDGKDFLANPEDMKCIIPVATEMAIERAKLFSKQTGILVGISSGANLLASEEYLLNNRVDGIIVTMLCDRGERYMSIY